MCTRSRQTGDKGSVIQTCDCNPNPIDEENLVFRSAIRIALPSDRPVDTVRRMEPE